MTFSAKAALIKFCRFAPPLITQVATFVATRALANEYPLLALSRVDD